MAQTQQINPRISVMTRDLLQQACKERGCSQGELVESALAAFLTPPASGEHEASMRQELLGVEATLTNIVSLLETILARLDGQTEVPDVEPAKPPIATYEQMYGPIEAAPPPAWAAPRPPTRWRRWLLREDLP